MCRKAPAGVRALLPVANAFLVLGLLLPYFYHPGTQAGKDWSDALRGLIFGLYIGINLMVVWKYRFGRGCNTSSGHDDLPQ